MRTIVAISLRVDTFDPPSNVVVFVMQSPTNAGLPSQELCLPNQSFVDHCMYPFYIVDGLGDVQVNGKTAK